MSTLTRRQGAKRPRGDRVSAPHARRTDYPDLAPPVKPQESEPALSWPAWTDRKAITAAVPAEAWPAWTDATRFRISDEKGS